MNTLDEQKRRSWESYRIELHGNKKMLKNLGRKQKDVDDTVKALPSNDTLG